MAKTINGGKITFGIGYQVDESGLRTLKKDLAEIRQLSVSSPNFKGMKIDTKDLIAAKQTARDVSNALERAFNPKLNTYNISKFTKELNNIGVDKIARDFKSLGPAGVSSFRQLTASVATTGKEIKKTHKLLDSWGDTLGKTIKWTVSSSIINSLSGQIQQAYGFTKNLDRSLNDIRIVTGKSADEMERFAKQATKAAKELGAGTTDYTEASLIYYQQGLADDDVKARTNTTIKAANVTGQSASQVSEQLTAVWNGYQIAANQTEAAVDKLAAVAATSASDLEELSTGISRVASAANNMGVGLDQLTAMISTTISVTREAPETIGTTFKTFFSRMADLKMGGSDEEGVTMGKVSGGLANYGINILDETGELRNMGTVAEEVAAKWDTWTKAQQTAVAELAAGNRQYSRFMALFDNWDMYEKALETSKNSGGTLEKQNETYLDSMEAKLQQYTTSQEAIWNKMFDSNGFKGLLDVLTNINGLVGFFVDSLGGAVPIMTTLGGLATKLFSKQIAEGVATFVDNIGLKNKGNEADKQRAEFMQQAKLSTGRSDNQDPVVQDIVSRYETMSKYTNIMNQEQAEASNEAIKGYAEAADALNTYEQQIKTTENALKQFIAQQNQEIENPEDKVNVSGLDLTRRDFGIGRENLEKITDDGGILSEYIQNTLGETQSIFSELSDGLKQDAELQDKLDEAIKKQKESRGKKQRQAGKEVSAAREALKDTKTEDYIEGKASAAKKLLRSTKDKGMISDTDVAYKNATNALEKYLAVQKDSKKTDQEKEKSSKELAAALEEVRKKAQENALALSDQVDPHAGNVDKGVTEWERRSNAAEAYKAQIDSLEQELASIDFTQGFVDMAGGAMQALGALESITNLFDIWTNEDLSIGEKIMQSLTLAGPAIASFTAGMNGIQQGWEKLKVGAAAYEATQAELTATQAAAAASTTAHAGANALDTTAEKANTEAKSENVGATAADTGAQAANTSAKVAGAGATNVLTVAIHGAKAAVQGFFAAMGPIGWAILAVTALATILVTVVENLDNAEKKQKRLNEAAEAWNKAANTAKEQVKAFIDLSQAYENARSHLDSLVQGTEEWTTALEKNNAAVMDLISNLSELAQYAVRDDETGLWSIPQEVIDKALAEKKQIEIKTAQMSQAANWQRDSVEKNKNIDAELSHWGMADYYSALSEAIKKGSSEKEYLDQVQADYLQKQYGVNNIDDAYDAFDGLYSKEELQAQVRDYLVYAEEAFVQASKDTAKYQLNKSKEAIDIINSDFSTTDNSKSIKKTLNNFLTQNLDDIEVSSTIKGLSEQELKEKIAQSTNYILRDNKFYELIDGKEEEVAELNDLSNTELQVMYAFYDKLNELKQKIKQIDNDNSLSRTQQDLALSLLDNNGNFDLSRIEGHENDYSYTDWEAVLKSFLNNDSAMSYMSKISKAQKTNWSNWKTNNSDTVDLLSQYGVDMDSQKYGGAQYQDLAENIQNIAGGNHNSIIQDIITQSGDNIETALSALNKLSHVDFTNYSSLQQLKEYFEQIGISIDYDSEAWQDLVYNGQKYANDYRDIFSRQQADAAFIKSVYDKKEVGDTISASDYERLKTLYNPEEFKDAFATENIKNEDGTITVTYKILRKLEVENSEVYSVDKATLNENLEQKESDAAVLNNYGIDSQETFINKMKHSNMFDSIAKDRIGGILKALGYSFDDLFGAKASEAYEALKGFAKKYESIEEELEELDDAYISNSVKSFNQFISDKDKGLIKSENSFSKFYDFILQREITALGKTKEYFKGVKQEIAQSKKDLFTDEGSIFVENYEQKLDNFTLRVITTQERMKQFTADIDDWKKKLASGDSGDIEEAKTQMGEQLALTLGIKYDENIAKLLDDESTRQVVIDVMATGDYDKFEEWRNTDYVKSVIEAQFKGNDQAIEDAETFVSKINNELDDIKAGKPATEEFYTALQDMLVQTGATATQIQGILNALGLQLKGFGLAQWAEGNQDTIVKLAAKFQASKGNMENDADWGKLNSEQQNLIKNVAGSGTSLVLDQLITDDGNLNLDLYRRIQGKKAADSAFEVVAGNYNLEDGTDATDNSGKTSGSGSGGSKSTSDKSLKTDKTQKEQIKEYEEKEKDIYREINAELKNYEHQMNAIQRIQNKAVGAGYLKALEDERNLIDKQVDALRRKKTIAEKYIKTLQDRIKLEMSEVGLTAEFDENGKLSEKAYDALFDYYNDAGRANADAIKEQQVLYNKTVESIESKTQAYNDAVTKYNEYAAKVREGITLTTEEQTTFDNLGTTIETLTQNIGRLKNEAQGYKDTISDLNTENSNVNEKLNKIISDNSTLDEQVLNVVPEIEEDIADKLDAKIESQIKSFHYSVDISLDLSNAERQWNEFKRKVLDKGDRFSLFGDDLIKQGNTLLSNLQSFGNDIPTLAQHVTDITNEVNTITTGGTGSIYGDNQAQAIEDLKKYRDQLMETFESIEDAYQEINEIYNSMLDKTQEAFDRQLNAYTTINDILEHNIAVVKKLNGDKNFSAIGKFYDKEIANNLGRLDFLKKEAQFWQDQMNKETKNSEAWLSAREKWLAAQSELNSAVENSIDTIIAEYQNTVAEVMDNLAQKMTNGLGLDYVNDEWELINKNADTYLDKINKAFEIQKLQDKYADAISKSNNPKIQERLTQAMNEQSKYLKEKEKLTKYDVERANLLYEIELKKIALEEAQQNKTQMRLRRDSQGNYSYQFVANQDAINDAQSQLDALQNSLYNLDKEAYVNNLESIKTEYENFQNQLAEIAADQTLSEEERLNRQALLYEQYEQLINDYNRENLVIRGNLQDSAFEELSSLYDQNLEDFQTMSQDEIDTLMTELVPQWSSGVQAMSDEFNAEGGFGPATKATIAELEAAQDDYKRNLDALAESAGINLGEITSGYEDTTTAVQGLIAENQSVMDFWSNQISVVHDLRDAIADLVDQYESLTGAVGTITAANDAIRKAQSTQGNNNTKKKKNTDNTNKPTKKNPETEEPAQEPQQKSDPSANGDDQSTLTLTSDIAKQIAATIWWGGDAGNWGNAGGKPNRKDIDKIFGTGAYDTVQGWVNTVSTSMSNSQIANTELYKYWIKIGQRPYTRPAGFDTGGYTGEWGHSGKLALLHEKEIVLNKEDTKNILTAVNIVRDFSNVISSLEFGVQSRMAALSAASASSINVPSIDNSQTLDQQVHIEASFPNVSNSNEIEEAFNNLVNMATQHVYQNKR